MAIYYPSFEKDSCGFGLIAQIDNEASHYLIKTAIESLSRLAHRGAVDPDGKTGDGCGILVKKPLKFIEKISKQASIELSKNFAIGSIFVNQDKAKASTAITRLAKELRQEELELVYQREVPINREYCGINALKTLPNFIQIFVNAPESMDEEIFETKLYIARRRTEIAFQDRDKVFYISSLSSRLLSYKGMIMPYNLDKFFLDLQDPDFESSLCLYHQRFSTNTFPEWRLAQPFRLLAHNGEINTINGNRNWSISRETKYSSPQIPNIAELLPLVSKDGSDSMSLDNMLEGLIATGVNPLKAIRMLIPPAWQNSKTMNPRLKAMYEYYSLHVDPWDGPAAIVLTNGKVAACSMDRNGLRPARYVLTKDNFLTIASEIGVYDYDPANVAKKGRLKPGEMIAVDLEAKTFLSPDSIDEILLGSKPYDKWITENAKYLKPIPEEEEPGCDSFFEHELSIYQKQFQVSIEEREQILAALAQSGQEAIGSMGDDTPLAVLSSKPRALYEYFRQQFAQVTNPPIDPIRESDVMSLRTCLGKEVNPFVELEENATRIDMPSPILSRCMFKSIMQIEDPRFAHELIDLTYDKNSHLEQAIKNLCQKAENAVRAGKVILILSDKNIGPNRLPVHALLALAAINARLCAKGLRCDANLIVETATARDPHHCAVLIGYGATAIYPYLSYQILYQMAKANQIQAFDTVKLMQKYRDGIDKGLLKIFSKMGISTINSYRGAMLFEAIGLHEEVINLCFPGTISRIQGATFDDLEKDFRDLSLQAWDSAKALDIGALMKYYPNGEYHAFNPEVVINLQNSVISGNYEDYKKFSNCIKDRPPVALRDLMELNAHKTSIDINEVESEEKILARFVGAAMSIGALSPEAHEAIAIAMNRIGGKSNSGEGGEDPSRYKTDKVSKIKQIASARFGVSPAYLVNAEVLQIKIAQGAKPGEGGQLPAAKVNDLIAKLRYTKPNTTLISPPPHHDIYSIEDLAQLIFDLKQINPEAEVSVKLVSEPGVGTIAAGVTKTFADSITIAGHDGGTGASPISSIRSAGCPWELGLVETVQVLRQNNIRDRVKIQVDGGLKTGLDIVKAAILGAESFGFGTTLLIVLGCKYLRICHLNNCATGIATQNEILREKHFKGLPERIETYLRFVAREVREILAYLGEDKLENIIAKTELLKISKSQNSKHKNLDLAVLLETPKKLHNKARFCRQSSNPPTDRNPLAYKMLEDSRDLIDSRGKGVFHYSINNTSRSIGALVSGYIAKLYGDDGLEEASLRFEFKGNAGQSFGVWNIKGLDLILEGDSNDYVGKGMAGGKIVIYPPSQSSFASEDTPIAGNTCLYGATGGSLFASGQVGERFAVRNSGAIAVVEGLGDHGCEYMTGGIVVVLGKIGKNFGAGMTGGMAFVYDPKNLAKANINEELVEILNLEILDNQDFNHLLKYLIESFGTETKNTRVEFLLKEIKNFILIKPKSRSLTELIHDYKSKSIFRTRA